MKNFIKATIMALITLNSLSAFSQQNKRPNIVWIFTDDHSYQTIGAYGGRLKELNPTPNLDKLASEGMRFDKCYVENSICGPSRAALLTGKFSHKHGKYKNGNDPFNHDQQQFQKILQKNGYQTAMVGKIHIAGNMQGFDYWEVLISQGEYENPFMIDENGKNRYEGYTTDIITDKSLDWLENKRDKEKPFMLMIHHKAPHRPWIPKKEHMSKYKDTFIPEPATLFDDYSNRTSAARDQEMMISKHMRLDTDLKLKKLTRPNRQDYSYDERFSERQEDFTANTRKGDELVRHKYQMYMKDYLRCIWSVDENIGRVIKYLEEKGLEENTIVMYSSDQGFYMGEHGWFDKRFMYEESFRTPLIVKWPGTVKAGTVNKDLVQNIDFAETFLDLAGVEIPSDMQGKSIVPLLQGKKPKDWRKSLYYHYYEYPGWHSVKRHEGIADKRYKLIRFYGMDVLQGEEWEFYDLKKDPSELNNSYNDPANSSRIKEMKLEMIRLREQYEVPEKPIPQVARKR